MVYNEKIDLEVERDAIVTFLDRYWDVETTRPLSGIVDEILEMGKKSGISIREGKLEEKLEVYNIGIERTGERNLIEFSRTEPPLCFYFDIISSLVSKLEKDFTSVEPKDYQIFKEEHDSDDRFDGGEEFEFGGAELGGDYQSRECVAFVDRLRPGEVYYQEENQVDSVLYVLIRAMYARGEDLGEYSVGERYDYEWICEETSRLANLVWERTSIEEKREAYEGFKRSMEQEGIKI